MSALWECRPHEADVGSQYFQRLLREICRKRFRKLLRVTQFMRHARRVLFPVINTNALIPLTIIRFPLPSETVSQ